MSGYIFPYFNKINKSKVNNKLCWFDLKKEFDYRMNTKYGCIYTSTFYNNAFSINSPCFIMAMICLNNMDKDSTIAGFNYVYLISGTHNGITRYKIGKANNVDDRVKMFNIKVPFDIDLIRTFKVKDALSFESKLHKEYHHKRLSGEWFDLSEKDIMEISTIGMKKESEDIMLLTKENIIKIENEKRKNLYSNDKQYISYLESILVFQNIDFLARIE